MGSPATPPWHAELVAKNHKVVRNMWHSEDSYLNPNHGPTTRDGDHSNNASGSNSKTGGNNKKQVVEPKSTSMNVTQVQPHTIGRTTMAAVVQEQMQRMKANKRKTRTENTSPIREDGGFMDDVNPKSKQYMRNREEESILEYGPGIVRKLRSRYQSLALRQFSARPSLRRSASLENVLDMDMDASGEGIKPESPSPTPFEQNYTNKRSSDNKGEDKSNEVLSTGMTKSKSATAVLEQNQNHSQIYEKKPPGPRGRAAVSERRDRMRRARSVDALQRTKHEEEILEKFKAVVLPKEEIVIIEVSKPRANLNLNGLGGLSNNSTSYYLATAGDKAYPTQLFISPDRTTAGLTVSETSQSGNRARSFISPEHELPPHDIVRETARIFEKNQENNKRIGHALRLSKSPSQSNNSSSPSSPTPQHHKGPTLAMAQGVQPINLTDKNSTFNNLQAKPTSLSLGLKQVGIIRPTVSHPAATSHNANADKTVKTSEQSPNLFSPILSPSQSPYKTFLQQHSSKPPLSPKPLFTSTPKPLTVKNPVESSVNQPPTPVFQQPSKLETAPKKTVVSLPESVVKSPSLSANKEVNGETSKAQVAAVEKAPLSSNKDRESPSSMRKPLKHVPNSFTITSDIQEIVPIPVPPVTQKSSPSPAVNGVSRGGSGSPKEPTESKSVKTATSKPIEPPKVSNAKHRERQKSPPPQPQRGPPVAPSTPPRKVEESSNTSQLRVHQKQKSNQAGNSPMVFNFTARSSVPDYIEDDGLHKGRLTLAGTVSDESVDDIDSTSDAHIDATLINFVGANVIINGKSSIQTKPRSKKMNISFNEDAITTYEYPSESSLLAEVETNETDMLGYKGPSVINTSGNGLSSYTSKLANNNYQLGNFEATSPKKPETSKKENETELIEDYLKPDSENTTWSNELTADIMF